jgi:hypothetical protein
MLSSNQRDKVVELLNFGWTGRAIARELHIAHQTVDSIRNGISPVKSHAPSFHDVPDSITSLAARELWRVVEDIVSLEELGLIDNPLFGNLVRDARKVLSGKGR